ncbi:MAG: hypothetical protein GAK28_00193 [Luteibacter sp.]|nr:MAG: hypothetical protein GAK28_00193 [Luteibacter sp.]
MPGDEYHPPPPMLAGNYDSYPTVTYVPTAMCRLDQTAICR